MGGGLMGSEEYSRLKSSKEIMKSRRESIGGSSEASEATAAKRASRTNQPATIEANVRWAETAAEYAALKAEAKARRDAEASQAKKTSQTVGANESVGARATKATGGASQTVGASGAKKASQTVGASGTGKVASKLGWKAKGALGIAGLGVGLGGYALSRNRN